MTGQRGVALVVAMLVVAIAALVATGLIERQELAIRRAQGALASAISQARAPALIKAALRELPADAPLPASLMVDGARVRVGSAQGCLNVNALVSADGGDDPLAERRLRALLGVLGARADVLPALQDWLDPDARVRVGGAEDDYYSRRRPPRRAANAPLQDLSELALLRHASRALVATLGGHACALPPGAAIDVNHVDAPLWQALADGLAPRAARDLVELTRSKPFTDLGALAAHPLLAGARIEPAGLTVRSDLLEVTVTDPAPGAGSDADAPVALHARVRRNGGEVRLLARHWGEP